MNSCSVNNKQGGDEKLKEKGVPWPGQKEEYYENVQDVE